MESAAMKLHPVDRDALERAIEIAKAESPGRARQIDDKLKTESWRAVAEFAASCCQDRALATKPWELAPVSVDEDDAIPDDDDHRRKGRAITLLRRLLAAGLSRYEPTPLAALEKAAAAKIESIEPPTADRVT
jgi:hypothetical protein